MGLLKIGKALSEIFSLSELNDEFYEEIEEILVSSDTGFNTSLEIVSALKDKVKEKKIKTIEETRELLREILRELLLKQAYNYDFLEKKSVILMVGVNGVGKTTTIGKLAYYFKNIGKKITLVAADTFRSGAIEQLDAWAKKVDVPIILGQSGGDPGSVVYDGTQSARAKKTDILLVDTAGRLTTKENLMRELHKIKEIIKKNMDDVHIETLLVIDGTTGQNGIIQAKEFEKSLGEIDGIVLTKLDGSGKGGIGLAIAREMNIPIKYIGTGEKVEDLKPFNIDEYVNSIC